MIVPLTEEFYCLNRGRDWELQILTLETQGHYLHHTLTHVLIIFMPTLY